MSNPASHEDRRQFKRAIFTLEDNVIGTFSIAGVPDGSVKTNIVNLSEGGLQFTLAADLKHKVKAGDHLVILQINAPANLKFLVNIDAQIKWVLLPEIFEHAGAGCQFINISQTSRQQIASFVQTWIKSRS